MAVAPQRQQLHRGEGEPERAGARAARATAEVGAAREQRDGEIRPDAYTRVEQHLRVPGAGEERERHGHERGARCRPAVAYQIDPEEDPRQPRRRRDEGVELEVQDVEAAQGVRASGHDTCEA